MSEAANATDTTGATSTYWWGLDSTQILIIFLTLVFAVLIIFLLVYYYCIRGMRQNSTSNRLALKSASGSIGEDKSRNIFAHPEKQLAVDQSTRANPNSPASSDAEAAPPQQPVNIANLPSAKQQQQQGGQASPSPMTNTSASGGPSSSSQASTPRQLEPAPAAARNKSHSSSKNKNKTNEESTGRLGVLGALAGLRDTLKDTRE